MKIVNLVLVIEDSPEIFSAMKDCLADICDLVHADSIESAKVQLGNQNFSLVIADIFLPDGNGIEFCKQALCTGATPFLFLSGSGTIDDKIQSFAIGAADYISKPFDPRELRARIRSRLEQPS